MALNRITHINSIPVEGVELVKRDYPKMELPDVSSYWDTFMSAMLQEFYEKKERLIRSRMIALGFNPDDHEWIKENCQAITVEGEDFLHYYFHFDQPDEIRIISFKITPEPLPEIDLRNPDFSTHMNLNQQYY